MSLFSHIFTKQNIPLLHDLSAIGTDIHSHILPGLDDGAKTIDETLEIIRNLASFGYKKLIMTPHVMDDFYRNTPDIIHRSLNIIREAVSLENISVEIGAAAEYYIDFSLQEKIEKHELLTIGNNYVLFELSYYTPPKNLNEIIFSLHTNGYKPVLAHPERYIFFHNDFSKYSELKVHDVLFQLNINSLACEYSILVKKIAEKLIIENMIDFTGTDLHNVSQINFLKTAIKNKHLTLLVNGGRMLNNSI
ncbi:MAG: capsular biosynthesis protein [Bacteroidia bacterium]|nr:capsular biosynthesis protein [Bacteroidia bacterium]